MDFGHPGNLQALGCIYGVPLGKRTSHSALMPLVGRVSTPSEPTMRKWTWMPVERTEWQVLEPGQSLTARPCVFFHQRKLGDLRDESLL